MGYREKNSTLDHSVVYAYNADNLIESITETVNGVSKTYTYTYNEYDRLVSETVDDTTVTYTYDEFGRLSNQVTKQGETTVLSEPYVYVSPKSGVTSTQVYRYRTTTATGNSTWYYSYDQNGNITYVDSSAFGDVTYEYDSQGQLLWEYSNVTWYATQWEYDDAGNILSRKVYDYYFDEIDSLYKSDSYSYTDTQWGDLLTGYNGRTLRYDGIGNLTNDGIWTYAWQHGRQLVSMTSGSTTWTYTYNADGLRTQKTDGTNTYTYIYNGSKLTAMTKGNDTLYFTYDAVGNPLTVTYNGTVYYYGTNLQGDIAEIYNAAGTMVVGYRYNAYGELDSMFGSMADTLGTINPLRYRGYVYDTETELYYLQSRYYNPEWGRFINADGLVTTGQGFIGNNMFAYCNNNPVMYVDPTGAFLESFFAALGEKTRYAIEQSIKNSPNLDVRSAFLTTYDCLGNGIVKQTHLNLPGYHGGDSVEVTYGNLVLLVGQDNIRRLDSIDDSIYDNEVKVALRCGPTDYHFIREINGVWCNKSGMAPAIPVPKEYVIGDTWFGITWDFKNREPVMVETTCYTGTIIYYALKVDWYEQ